jgi:hypothetical protein
MGALPRPDLSPGAHRDLVEGLHQLHHQAGWPSLRALARETGVSHTTVSKVMSSPALPSWGTVELLVEAMGGDVAHFHRLWLDASAPHGAASSPTPVAGRGAELAALRRHLEAGTGLLLVEGDAGMGKTTLLAAAIEPLGPAIVVGHCFPLSANTPFMPLVDALRSLHEIDGGQRLTAALAECAPYVAGQVARLLPELSSVASARPAGEWARPQLFGALGSLLRTLSDRARIALVIEDVHWADANTLDFLEHLTGHGSPVPMAASWRLNDLSTASWSTDWFNRVRRLPCVGEIVLSPLSEDATADQLRRLAPEMDPATVYARSRGHPLFTAQLAAHGEDGDLPRLLADLLDSRLGTLDGSAWRVARVLGVADRPLRFDVLAEAAGGDADSVRSGLRALADRWLVTSHGAQSAVLAHPLLAEAVRRRLLPGEGPEQHRVLAQVLGRTSDTAPAEVAEHWQAAGDEVQELGWRVAAARAAAERYDRAQEAEQWLRVLEIWPPGGAASEVGRVSRETAYLAAIDALQGSMQFDRAAELSDAAEDVLRPTDAAVQAELLRYAAMFRGQREGSDVGRQLIDEALALYEELPVSEGLVRARDWKQNLLRDIGEFAAAHDVARTAVEAALELGDPLLTRRSMGRLAWHVGVHGDLAGARDLLDRAEADLPAGTDPLGDVRRSVIETDLLVILGAHVDDVVDAGSRGIATAAELGVDNYDLMLIRFNTAWAMVLAGRVESAAELVPSMDTPVNVLDRWAAHLLGNVLDGLRGDCEVASRRIQQLRQAMPGSWENDLELLVVAERIESWLPAAMRQPGLIVTALDVLVGRAPPWLVAPGLVAAARAAADLRGPADAGRARATHAQHVDFFQRSGLPEPGQQAEPYLGVHSAAWAVEVARLTGDATVDQWVRVAHDWDNLGRPHDAAYCRWRAAQRALADGQGTLAANLLARAARDAREHVPLSTAVAATRRGAR